MPVNPPEKRKLAAIMFTDLVGYSALTHRNEALALELLADNQRLLRAQFTRFDGREVKNTGDGFLVEFPSALQATQCALEIQRSLAAHNSGQPEPRRLRVRIGLHVGDVVCRQNDVYGDGVNIAARIEPLAVGGGICLSDTVYSQVRNKLPLTLIKLDSPKLKNIETPIDVYRVALPGEAAPTPVAPVVPVAAARIRRVWRNRLVALMLVILAIALGVGILVFHPAHPRTPLAAVAANAGFSLTSIAVLPFASLSPDKNDEYVSDGFTEELLNALAKVDGLRVPGRASSFAFKDRTGAGIYHEIGDRLHVGSVLGGSVRKVGNQLRVTAELTSVADGTQLWSQEYNGDMDDIIAFQTNLAKSVVERLQVKLGLEDARQLARPPTVNGEAHRLYLLGRSHQAKGNFAGFTKAKDYFQQAIDLDPNFALAYCGLADSYGFTAGIQMPGREGWTTERDYAKRALAIDPELPEAHFSLGLALASSFQWEEGEKEMKRALELNPNMAVAYDQYAFLLTCLRRHDEAITNSLRAVELEPLSPLMNADLAWWLLFAQRYEEAETKARLAVAMDSNISLGHWALGWSLLWQGKHAAAVTEFQKANSIEPTPFFEAALGYACGVAGDRAQAEKILARLQGGADGQYVSPGLLAFPQLGLGRRDEVVAELTRSFETQDYPCQLLKVDPVFDSFRNDPQFVELLKKAGLYP